VDGGLVILPRRHGSHVSKDSKSIDPRRPSSWSFFMRFTPTVTNRRMNIENTIFKMEQPFVIDSKWYLSHDNRDPITMFILKAGT
jgi:hypothetical protein